MDAGAVISSSGGAAPASRSALLQFTAAAGLGAVLAVIGPYDTFSMAGLQERLVYWVVVLLAAYVVYWPACLWADAQAVRRGWPRLPVWAAAIAVQTAPMTLIVWLASYRHTPRFWPTLEMYVGFSPGVLAVAAPMILLIWLVGLARRGLPSAGSGRSYVPAAAGGAQAARASGAAFLDRLPPRLGRDLLALEMEDHYVRAHTPRGSALVLMRMRDAVEALEHMDGGRVHRSWWVARSAVASAEREGRSVRLVLSNGLRVPLPRDRLAEFRAQGWVPPLH